MCGIAGLFFKRAPNHDLLEAFAQAVQVYQGDRGPDDFGALRVTDRLYFLHNRLAIIDPGRARQPMADDEGVISFNGKIYNFAELRIPGETYHLDSDTEVLLKGLNQLIKSPSYYGVATIFEPVILERLFRRTFAPPRSVDGLGEAIRLDILDRPPNDVLTRTDRATMGASIEARVPFLSHELVNYSLRIDENLLISGHTQKYLLKKLAERYMPKSNIYRRKIGFDLPLADWLRGPLRPMLEDMVQGSWQSGLVDFGFIREIIDLHQAGTINAADKIWAFMMPELNHRALLALRRPSTSAVRLRFPKAQGEVPLWSGGLVVPDEAGQHDIACKVAHDPFPGSG